MIQRQHTDFPISYTLSHGPHIPRAFEKEHRLKTKWKMEKINRAKKSKAGKHDHICWLEEMREGNKMSIRMQDENKRLKIRTWKINCNSIMIIQMK